MLLFSNLPNLASEEEEVLSSFRNRFVEAHVAGGIRVLEAGRANEALETHLDEF